MVEFIEERAEAVVVGVGELGALDVFRFEEEGILVADGFEGKGFDGFADGGNLGGGGGAI